MAIYKGFSTASWVNGNNTLSITDVECVEQNLLNHIYTKMGERVHMAGYGTQIPDMVFELDDKITIDIVKQNITSVINDDPRVELITIKTYALPNDNTIAAIVNLKYIEFNVTNEINIRIAADQTAIR